MSDGVHTLLEAHVCACNGRAWESLRGFWSPTARCDFDGKSMGEGPRAIQTAFEASWKEGLVGRIVDADGEKVLVGYDAEHGRARVMIRLEGTSRITGCKVERLS